MERPGTSAGWGCWQCGVRNNLYYNCDGSTYFGPWNEVVQEPACDCVGPEPVWHRDVNGSTSCTELCLTVGLTCSNACSNEDNPYIGDHTCGGGSDTLGYVQPEWGGAVCLGSGSCDDPVAAPNNAWNAFCCCGLSPVCGNGVLEGVEQCDDGNLVNGDGCNANCTLDSLSCPHDKCAVGKTINPACDPCVPEVCGLDSYCCEVYWDSRCVDTAQAVCQACSPVCGNGVVEDGEECDDGSNLDGDGCTGDCKIGIGACTDPELGVCHQVPPWSSRVALCCDENDGPAGCQPALSPYADLDAACALNAHDGRYCYDAVFCNDIVPCAWSEEAHQCVYDGTRTLKERMPMCRPDQAENDGCRHGMFCGDGVCQAPPSDPSYPYETAESCPIDCHPRCDDHFCSLGEDDGDCQSCPGGLCTPTADNPGGPSDPRPTATCCNGPIGDPSNPPDCLPPLPPEDEWRCESTWWASFCFDGVYCNGTLACFHNACTPVLEPITPPCAPGQAPGPTAASRVPTAAMAPAIEICLTIQRTPSTAPGIAPRILAMVSAPRASSPCRWRTTASITTPEAAPRRRDRACRDRP